MRGDTYFQKLEAEYKTFLPDPAFPPTLSKPDFDRYLALGEKARAAMNVGEHDGAAAAYREQIRLLAVNPEPHVALAMIAALRKDGDGAIEHLRDAVYRGFTDLGRIERAEAWGAMKTDDRFHELQEALPDFARVERQWASWDSFQVVSPPAALAEAYREHSRREVIIEKMGPAWGPVVVRRWTKLNDRILAAVLEAYVAERADAADAGEALTRLMDLYAGGALGGWTRLPATLAPRLGKIADTALARFPDAPPRDGALTLNALARYADRDRKGRLADGAAGEVLAALSEVATRFPDSRFAPVATEGRVRTAYESGKAAEAGEILHAWESAHPEEVAGVRERLGTLALTVGGVPPFRATALDGSAVAPEDLRGKVVVFDFWATWCAPCVDGLPTLRSLADRHGEKVAVVGISLDDLDDLSEEALRSWIEARHVPGRHVFDGRGWDSTLVRSFGVKEIPFSVVVAADGKVVAVGETGRALEKAVKGALD